MRNMHLTVLMCHPSIVPHVGDILIGHMRKHQPLPYPLILGRKLFVLLELMRTLERQG